MPLSTLEKAEVSFLHRQRIQSIFNSHIKGELGIDHFSINLFLGNDNSLFFSPTPQMASELCKKKFIIHDSNYRKELYSNYSIYPWRAVAQHEIDDVINHVKEEKFGMHHGMMIVRNLGHGRYVMYSIATHKREPKQGMFQFLYHAKANHIAEMGDFMYNELNALINEYTQKDGIDMPIIDEFKPLPLEQSYHHDIQFELHELLQQGSMQRFAHSIENKSLKFLQLAGGGKLLQTA